MLNKLDRVYAAWTYPLKLVWITQAEGKGMCQCPDCEAVRTSQGSNSANWVLFVNAIAEEVEKKYPDVMIGMFAFLHTEAPPKTIKLRRNVLIYSALLARNFLDPISAYAFHADSLKKWGQIASRVYVWDYDANFRNYYYPTPTTS